MKKLRFKKPYKTFKTGVWYTLTGEHQGFFYYKNLQVNSPYNTAVSIGSDVLSVLLKERKVETSNV